MSQGCALKDPVDLGEPCPPESAPGDEFDYIVTTNWDNTKEICARDDGCFEDNFMINRCPPKYQCGMNDKAQYYCYNNETCGIGRIQCGEDCVEIDKNRQIPDNRRHCGAKGFCYSTDISSPNFIGEDCGNDECIDGRCIVSICQDDDLVNFFVENHETIRDIFSNDRKVACKAYNVLIEDKIDQSDYPDCNLAIDNKQLCKDKVKHCISLFLKEIAASRMINEALDTSHTENVLNRYSSKDLSVDEILPSDITIDEINQLFSRDTCVKTCANQYSISEVCGQNANCYEEECADEHNVPLFCKTPKMSSFIILNFDLIDALLHGKGSICEKYDDLVSSYTEVDPKDNKVKSICKTKNIANCAVGNTGSLNRCIAEFILDLAFESKQSLLPVEYQSIKYTTEDFEKFIIITEGGMCNRSSSAL